MNLAVQLQKNVGGLVSCVLTTGTFVNNYVDFIAVKIIKHLGFGGDIF